MEWLLLAGFASEAGMTTEPDFAQGRSDEAVWERWNALVFPYYARTDIGPILLLEDAKERRVSNLSWVLADKAKLRSLPLAGPSLVA